MNNKRYIIISSGSSSAKSTNFHEQNQSFLLPIPLLAIWFQFQELRLRHYGDGYSNWQLCKILFSNVSKRIRRNPTLFLHRTMFIRFVVVHCPNQTDLTLLLDDMSPTVNQVWFSRYVVTREFLKFSGYIRDFFDLENEGGAKLIVWRILYISHLGYSKRTLELSRHSQPSTPLVNVEDSTPLVQSKEIVHDYLAHAQILGGRFVIVDGAWRPDSPYDFIPKDLPSRGLVIGHHGKVEMHTNSESLRLEGSYVFAVTNSNYYHFLVETLPRMVLSASKFEVERTWIIPDSTPAQIQSIIGEVFGNRILEMKWHQVANVQDLLYIRDFRYRKQVDVEDFDQGNIFRERFQDLLLVRDTLLRAFRDASIHLRTCPKLFLTRQSWQERTPVSLENITCQLEAQGFTVVDPADFSISEQIAMFSNATEIVALGGASLTNLMFCKSGTEVEILSMTDQKGDVFWQDYARLFDLKVRVRRVS
jgi:hypothetical protein